VLAAALAVVLGLAAWLALRGRQPLDGDPVVDASIAVTVERTTTRTAAPLRPRAPANDPSAENDLAADGLPYMPAGVNAARPDGAVHPHPITTRHRRIARENALLGSLSDAMDGKDGARLRALLDTYRAEFPEDDHRLQRGYQVIADCLEHPGPESSAAAQYHFDHELASTLRRFVKRHCLESSASK